MRWGIEETQWTWVYNLYECLVIAQRFKLFRPMGRARHVFKLFIYALENCC